MKEPNDNRAAEGRKVPAARAASPEGHRRKHERPGPARPDTGLLYSVDDIAVLARVSKVAVIKLCLAGLMPEWREIDGRRYWDRAAATEAVALLVRACSLLRVAREKKIA